MHDDRTVPMTTSSPPSSRSPEEERAILAELVGMLATFPAASMDPSMQKARASHYLAAMAPFSPSAVRRAVSFWMGREHSEAGDRYAFPPSPPQLVRLARIAADAERAAAWQPSQAIAHHPDPVFEEFPEPTPEERARVTVLLRRASESLGMGNPRPIHMTAGERRDLAARANEHALRVEREAAGFAADDPISPALRRYLDERPLAAEDETRSASEATA